MVDNENMYNLNFDIHIKNKRKKFNFHQHSGYLYVYEKGVHSFGIKCSIVSLRVLKKKAINNIKQFKTALKHYLLTHALYSTDEYFKVHTPKHLTVLFYLFADCDHIIILLTFQAKLLLYRYVYVLNLFHIPRCQPVLGLMERKSIQFQFNPKYSKSLYWSIVQIYQHKIVSRCNKFKNKCQSTAKFLHFT
jgi:hypothetical protein